MDLNKLCRKGVKDLGWTTKPFNIFWNGNMWTGATDRHGMVVVKADSECVETSEAVTGKVVPRLNAATRYTKAHKTPLLDLRQFLGEPAWDCEKCDEVIACTACDGAEELCDSCGQEVTCKTCNGSGKNPCSTCKGKGYIGKGDTHRSGVIYGVAVNMNLLARYLSVVDGDVVHVSVGEKLDPLMVAGDGWVILLMPLDRVLADVPTYSPSKEES